MFSLAVAEVSEPVQVFSGWVGLHNPTEEGVPVHACPTETVVPVQNICHLLSGRGRRRHSCNRISNWQRVVNCRKLGNACFAINLQ